MKFVLIGTHTVEWIGRVAERGKIAAAKAAELSITVDASYYTQGQFDFVTVLDAPDAEAASRFSIWYAARGFGRIQTLRAFTAAEMESICTASERGDRNVQDPAPRTIPHTTMQIPAIDSYSQAELDKQYNPRAAVADFDAIIGGWAERSRSTRREIKCSLDIRYGSSSAESLDVFHSDTPNAPIHIFFHGGYWRSGDKSDVSFVAKELQKAGATVVIPNYALCPGVRIDELLLQCYGAIRWVGDNAAELRSDPARIHISGHSAGGHIVAMAMTEGQKYGIPEGMIRSGLAISGLYNLEPLRRSFLNAEIRLDPDQVRRDSPLGLVRETGAPLLLCLGELESREFHFQTFAYHDAWRERGNRAELLTVQGADHYSVLDAFGDPDHPLCKAAIRFLRPV